jgi:hypothetical protein
MTEATIFDLVAALGDPSQPFNIIVEKTPFDLWSILATGFVAAAFYFIFENIKINLLKKKNNRELFILSLQKQLIFNSKEIIAFDVQNKHYKWLLNDELFASFAARGPLRDIETTLTMPNPELQIMISSFMHKNKNLFKDIIRDSNYINHIYSLNLDYEIIFMQTAKELQNYKWDEKSNYEETVRRLFFEFTIYNKDLMVKFAQHIVIITIILKHYNIDIAHIYNDRISTILEESKENQS